MNSEKKPDTQSSRQSQSALSPAIVIQRPSQVSRLVWRLLLFALLVSIVLNFSFYSRYQEYFVNVSGPQELFHSGEVDAGDKIAIIRVSGTIMPPFTGRILKSIQRAGDDKNVKGVVLVVDSPGGLVADSHQIYHALKKLTNATDEQKKPVYVAMQRMAASGGYYISMGAGENGKIYVEPTTWTGSIGVIIPRYDLSGLAEEWKFASDPLKTGEFKDSLSPFRKLSDNERAVWNDILDDSYRRFIGVIADNRKSLDEKAVEELATGQIYTADQALKNGLVDETGYLEDAVASLKKDLALAEVRVVTYEYPLGLIDMLSGFIEAEEPSKKWSALLDSTVPRAMYFCSWAPGIPGW